MRHAVTIVGLALALLAPAATSRERPRLVRQPPRQPRFIPQSVSFISSRVGWAWGPSGWSSALPTRGVLARTIDGGRHWTVVGPAALRYAQPGPGYWKADSSVRFLDRLHGYLFGGLLLATADGGSTWRVIFSEQPVLDVETGAGRAYALTSTGLYRITRYLERIGPAVPGPRATLVVHGAAVYLLVPPSQAGQPAVLWASPDAGRSWRRESAPCTWSGALASALAAWSSDGLALACGGQPAAGRQTKTFFVSTDGGARWRLTGRIGFVDGYVLRLAAANAHTWVLAEAPGIELSTDGGHTWRPPRFTGRQFEVEAWGDVSFMNASDAVAVPATLNGSVLAFSRDRARTWTEVPFDNSAEPPAASRWSP